MVPLVGASRPRIIRAVAQSAASVRPGQCRYLSPVLGVAIATFAFHLVLSGRYGFHRDELYYLAAGRRPALGYVDHPPLVPLLARAITEVTGEHLWPLRAVAGAVHGVVVLLAALIARELGGGRRALLLAAVATATMPLFVATGSLFQTVVLDQMWWAVVLLLVVRLLEGADPRWWVAVGVVFGLGLQTKSTITLLGLGLAAGLVAVPSARGHLRTPWLWAGCALALALWLPNLGWQALNDWPSLEFIRNNNERVRDEEGRVGFVALQVAYIGPLALPFVGAGMIWLWRSRSWRVLAVSAATVAAVLLVVGGKAYYLGPLYVLGVAAGAVATEGWLSAVPRRWRAATGGGDAAGGSTTEQRLQWASAAEDTDGGPLIEQRRRTVASGGQDTEGGRTTEGRRWRLAVGALVVNGLVPLAAVAPVAPVGVYAGVFHDINSELGEEVGWPEMVDLVAAVRDVLPDDQQASARVVTASYGEAAAIDLYGPSRGLPRGTALSGHNSYAHWWPDDESTGTIITVRYARSTLEPYCDAIGPVAVVVNPQGVENEVAGTPILVCRGLRVTLDELRDALRRFR